MLSTGRVSNGKAEYYLEQNVQGTIPASNIINGAYFVHDPNDNTTYVYGVSLYDQSIGIEVGDCLYNPAQCMLRTIKTIDGPDKLTLEKPFPSYIDEEQLYVLKKMTKQKIFIKNISEFDTVNISGVDQDVAYGFPHGSEINVEHVNGLTGFAFNVTDTDNAVVLQVITVD